MASQDDISLQIWRVAVNIPLRRLFDYLPPRDFSLRRRRFKAGVRVRVPFGKRQIIGILHSVHDKSEASVVPQKLKPILEVLDNEPIISESILHLCRFASEYYQHPIGEVIACSLPTALRQGKATTMGLAHFYKRTDKELKLRKDAYKQLSTISLIERVPEGAREEYLLSQETNAQTLKRLCELGYIEKFSQEKQPVGTPEEALEAPLSLNSEQADAVQKVSQTKGFHAFYLDGVTGSGKTEVYLHCIANTLQQGNQALILIPEIALTPQTLERFRRRFSEPVVCLHSGLNESERKNAWLAAQTGVARIIIGTRSAIFTPLDKLGLLIIDEAHDSSFKQQDGFRYSARSLALVRGQTENIPVILGSATPSLESLYNLERGRYSHLQLHQRAGSAQLPQYQILDIRNRHLTEGLSQELLQAIGSHLDNNNQVLIFLNRRGYAPTLICNSCGWVARCQHCEANYTYHLNPHHLHCHHCDGTKRVPKQCPQCEGEHLHALGLGTERLEHSLQQCFPNVDLVRIDRDSTRKKGSLDNLLAKINQANNKQILLGTQMLAKGHHFPNVTLVCILDADVGFFSSDFRAAERMAQLITQVAGRAGRADKPGTVIIQTRNPTHPQLLRLIKEGYHSFAKESLHERQAAGLPPFSHFALLRAEANNGHLPKAFLTQLKNQALEINKTTNNGVTVMGPIPAPMEKRQGRYRFQLLLHGKVRSKLHEMLQDLTSQGEQLPENSKIRWSIDVDPIEMY